MGATAFSDDRQKLLEATDLLIDRSDLDMHEEIGKGQFGCVFRGVLRTGQAKGDEMEVAVKTLKASAGMPP